MSHEEEIKKVLSKLEQDFNEEILDDSLDLCAYECWELILISLKNLFSFLILPYYITQCWIKVDEQEAALLSYNGKVRRQIMSPGFYFNPMLSSEFVQTSQRKFQVSR